MYQRSPAHEPLFRLIQPVSATGWPRCCEIGRGRYVVVTTVVSSLMQLSNSARGILRIYLWRRRRAPSWRLDWNLSRGKEMEKESYVFFFFNFNQAHRIARFSSSFHFLRNFDRSQSGKEWCAALRVANTLDSRFSPGLRFSRNACWNGNDHDFHVKKILVDYSSSDLEKIRVLRFEISIDFSRRESII